MGTARRRLAVLRQDGWRAWRLSGKQREGAIYDGLPFPNDCETRQNSDKWRQKGDFYPNSPSTPRFAIAGKLSLAGKAAVEAVHAGLHSSEVGFQGGNVSFYGDEVDGGFFEFVFDALYPLV